MMSFPLYEGEVLKVCPYNRGHNKILASKFSTHIVKCQRLHAHSGLKVCPFNSTHLFPSAELPDHEKSCPSRPMQKITDAPNTAAALKNHPMIHNVDHQNVPLTGEFWDDSFEGTYDPTVKCRSEPSLLIAPVGLTKAKRVLYRKTRALMYNTRSSKSASGQLHMHLPPQESECWDNLVEGSYVPKKIQDQPQLASSEVADVCSPPLAPSFSGQMMNGHVLPVRLPRMPTKPGNKNEVAKATVSEEYKKGKKAAEKKKKN